MSTALHQCKYEHDVTLQSSVCLKQLPTVRTVIWSSVAVYTTFVSLQVAGLAETSVTQFTLVRFLSRVDSHVTKRIITYVTFVWFLSIYQLMTYHACQRYINRHCTFIV